MDRRILLIGDDPLSAERLSLLLATTGYGVVSGAGSRSDPSAIPLYVNATPTVERPVIEGWGYDSMSPDNRCTLRIRLHGA